MSAPATAAADVALALIESAPTEAAAEVQIRAARAAGASSNAIRRAWRRRVAATKYRQVPA